MARSWARAGCGELRGGRCGGLGGGGAYLGVAADTADTQKHVVSAVRHSCPIGARAAEAPRRGGAGGEGAGEAAGGWTHVTSPSGDVDTHPVAPRRAHESNSARNAAAHWWPGIGPLIIRR